MWRFLLLSVALFAQVPLPKEPGAARAADAEIYSFSLVPSLLEGTTANFTPNVYWSPQAPVPVATYWLISRDGRRTGACLFAHDRVRGGALLANDDATAWQEPVPVAFSNTWTVANSTCTLTYRFGATFSLNVRFAGGTAGDYTIHGWVLTADGAETATVEIGKWRVSPYPLPRVSATLELRTRTPPFRVSVSATVERTGIPNDDAVIELRIGDSCHLIARGYDWQIASPSTCTLYPGPEVEFPPGTPSSLPVLARARTPISNLIWGFEPLPALELTSFASTPAPPSFVVEAPIAGFGQTATFNVVVRDPNGRTELSQVVLRAEQPGSPALTCTYEPLLTGKNFAPLGASGSSCQLEITRFPVPSEYDDLIFRISLPPAAVPYRLSIRAADRSGLASPWTEIGIWTTQEPAIGEPPQSVVFRAPTGEYLLNARVNGDAQFSFHPESPVHPDACFIRIRNGNIGLRVPGGRDAWVERRRELALENSACLVTENELYLSYTGGPGTAVNLRVIWKRPAPLPLRHWVIGNTIREVPVPSVLPRPSQPPVFAGFQSGDPPASTRLRWNLFFNDPDGNIQLAELAIAIGDPADPSRACIFRVRHTAPTVQMEGAAPGGPQNDRCLAHFLDSFAGSGFVRTGHTSAEFRFSPSFHGVHPIYVSATDYFGLSSGWVRAGTHTVPPPSPPTISISASPSGPNRGLAFSLRVNDKNGVEDIRQLSLRLEGPATCEVDLLGQPQTTCPGVSVLTGTRTEPDAESRIASGTATNSTADGVWQLTATAVDASGFTTKARTSAFVYGAQTPLINIPVLFQPEFVFNHFEPNVTDALEFRAVPPGESLPACQISLSVVDPVPVEIDDGPCHFSEVSVVRSGTGFRFRFRLRRAGPAIVYNLSIRAANGTWRPHTVWQRATPVRPKIDEVLGSQSFYLIRVSDANGREDIDSIKLSVIPSTGAGCHMEIRDGGLQLRDASNTDWAGVPIPPGIARTSNEVCQVSWTETLGVPSVQLNWLKSTPGKVNAWVEVSDKSGLSSDWTPILFP